jgi:hypothetical protein
MYMTVEGGRIGMNFTEWEDIRLFDDSLQRMEMAYILDETEMLEVIDSACGPNMFRNSTRLISRHEVSIASAGLLIDCSYLAILSILESKRQLTNEFV